jgi:hypothetical protein
VELWSYSAFSFNSSEAGRAESTSFHSHVSACLASEVAFFALAEVLHRSLATSCFLSIICIGRESSLRRLLHRLIVGDDAIFLVLVAPSDGDSECSPVIKFVPITWTACHFGGRRPWFVCPHCGRRNAAIYIAGEYVACRHCLGLAYASQQESVRQRGLMKAQKIRMSLGGSPSMIEKFPDRPKGTHQTTFERLRAAHDQAADRSMAGLSRFLSGG